MSRTAQSGTSLTGDEELIIGAIEDGSYFEPNEIPTGLVNGSNVTFTAAATPNPADSLKVFVNGQRFKVTEDYTLSGATLTFVVAPETGDLILIDYTVDPT